MIRENNGKGFCIWKKDLDSGVVQKKSYNNNIEFWIYRHRPLETTLVLSPSSKKELEKSQPIYLHSIIVTKENSIVDNKDMLLVNGVKFDDIDVDKYLSKTKRK